MHTKGHQKKDEKQKHTKNRNDMDHGIVRRGRDLRWTAYGWNGPLFLVEEVFSRILSAFT